VREVVTRVGRLQSLFDESATSARTFPWRTVCFAHRRLPGRGGVTEDLLTAGHQVTVYNRTPGQAKELIAQGAKAAASVGEACRGDAVLTMLADDEAVESVVLGQDGVIASLSPGALHVSTSTISVGLSQRLTEIHARNAQQFIAAPVFGRPDAAAAGRLFVVAGGEPAALKNAAPLFNAIGQRTFVISPRLPILSSLAEIVWERQSSKH
jgi:3-hydroxyisobutyrate dehydrogenase-like beta-hydroxyacid dehydrogenase